MKKSITDYLLSFFAFFFLGILLFILLSIAVYPEETLKMGGELIHNIKEVLK